MRSQRHAGLSFVLAAIVAIAQLGAQAHAYSHLAKRSEPAQHSAHRAPCVECSAFAPLLSAVSGSSYPTVAKVVEPPAIAAVLATGVRRAAVCSAYRSRAPPAPSPFV